MFQQQQPEYWHVTMCLKRDDGMGPNIHINLPGLAQSARRCEVLVNNFSTTHFVDDANPILLNSNSIALHLRGCRNVWDGRAGGHGDVVAMSPFQLERFPQGFYMTSLFRSNGAWALVSDHPFSAGIDMKITKGDGSDLSALPDEILISLTFRFMN
jgi:hypothetical protein